MTSEQRQWLQAVEQERKALVAENAQLRRQRQLADWALTVLLIGAACALVVWVS
jgi:hypothetical protein